MGALDVLPDTLTGTLIVGDGRTWTYTSDGADWPASTRLRIITAAGTETVLTPVIATTLATWTVTVAETAAIRGTKTSGSLSARITTGAGDALRPWASGRISIVGAYVGSSAAQSLGTVTLGPHGPAIASGVVDEDGALVLTLENAVALDPIALPPLVGLTIDGDGDYETTPAGTAYLLTTDADGDYNVRTVA